MLPSCVHSLPVLLLIGNFFEEVERDIAFVTRDAVSMGG